MSAKIRTFEIGICDDCIQLKGETCHNPCCVFIRCSMQEVRQYLNQLMIRPLADGDFVYADGYAANEVVRP